MGYDCTLHLIDERAIRDEFVPKLLGRSNKKTPLDRVVQNSSELWTTARRSLEVDDPNEAAASVCQLAVMFSACSLPHQYERGFALSLWRDQEKDIAVEYPYEFGFSPEPLFSDIVECYPRLHNHFPTWFIGNYSTGVYIPSNQVPLVLSWIEERIAPMAKGDRRQFKGLLGILRAAADQHLAYWEATDLAVPMANEFPGDPNLMMARYLGNEPGGPARQLEQAQPGAHVATLWSRVIDGWLTSTDYRPFETNFWDLSVWPPRLAYRLPEFASALSRSRDGRWLLCSETNPHGETRTFRPRVYSDLGKQPDGEHPAFVDGVHVRTHEVGFVGNRLLVFRDPVHNAKAGDSLPPPLWFDGTSWNPAPGIPDAIAKPSDTPQLIRRPAVGVAQLHDGGDVVVWNGEGYELRGDRFEHTFAMEAQTSSIGWTSVPAGKDGFFYLSDRCLFEVHRHGRPISHAPKWTNIMRVSPGPTGSLILREGNNKDGDVAKLYFPTDGTFVHIEPEMFDDREYSFVHWSPSSDRFIVLCGRFLAVPTSAILSLPRFRASTRRKVKG